MTPCELALSIGGLAASLADRLSDEDLALLAAVLTQLGDTLETIAAQRARLRGDGRR